MKKNKSRQGSDIEQSNGLSTSPYYVPVQSPAPKKKSKGGWIFLWIFLALAAVGAVINSASQGSAPTSTPQTPSAPPVLQVIPGDSVTDGTVLKKTVMLYMDGADLEENDQNVTRSLQEVLNSGLNTELHNVLIYTGGSNRWHGFNIPANEDCIYQIRGGKLNLLKKSAPQNMGDGKTLEGFLRYCVENFPAQQYGLILCDHGGGPNHGVCADFRNNHDILSMAELQNAFRSAGFGQQSKMEFVFFDACLMGSVEVAFCMKDYANYMVASENVSYIYGSDYSFIRSLNTQNSGAQIGKQYVDCFYNASTRLGQSLDQQGLDVYDITYSCIDLSKMDQVETAMDALFSEANISSTLEKLLASASFRARGVMEYADSYGEATDTTYDLIDLVDWLQRTVIYQGNDLMKQLVAAVDTAVIHNRATTPHMNGLTVYYPHHVSGNFSYNSFGFSDQYSAYVKSCYTAASSQSLKNAWKNVASPAKGISSVAGLAKLNLALTEEQSESYASARYYILAKHELSDRKFAADDYVLVTHGSDFSLNEGRLLSAEFDARVPVIYAKDGTATPFCSPLYRKVLENGQVVYTTYASLNKIPDPADYPDKENDPNGLGAAKWAVENMKMDVVWLTMSIEGNELKPLYAERVSNSLPSRSLLNPADYDEIQFFSPIRHVTEKDGKLLPVNQWETENEMLTTTYPLGSFSLRLEELDEDVDYYAVTVLTDLYGNEYSSRPVSIR